MSKKSNPASYAAQKKKTRSRKPIPWALIAIGVAAALAVIGLLWVRPWQAAGSPAEISIQRAYEKYGQGTFFLDVRTQEEWNQVHLANAVLMPLDELDVRGHELPRDREIVIICRSGNRSLQARDFLVNAGFTQVSSVKGGINQWKAAGYPVVEATP